MVKMFNFFHFIIYFGSLNPYQVECVPNIKRKHVVEVKEMKRINRYWITKNYDKNYLVRNFTNL